MAYKDIISDELLAAFLEGNTSREETGRVLQAVRTDKQLQEVLNIAVQTTDDPSANKSAMVNAKLSGNSKGKSQKRQERFRG